MGNSDLSGLRGADHRKDVPPGQRRSTWSPISATLISGRHDAVLVDPLMTVEQGIAVADWVSTTGKNLTTVYITHGHGDHWFGLAAVRERFPGGAALTTAAGRRGTRPGPPR
jgi:glyoxylase-like metal-dependent hydrolase (beta-lactamase superfamily II)